MIENLESLVLRACDALRSEAKEIGGEPGQSPRFELFHAPNSICAQKVRTVLCQHDIPYVSHLVNLFEGQSYLPDYVRLRMAGCDALGGALALRHTGSTSTSETGCDGAVVPTLIDRETQQIIADSRRICSYLDALMPEPRRLRPPSLGPQIDRDIVVVDNLPNYQMLMMRKTPARESNGSAGMVAANFSRRKVGWCDKYIAAYPNDPDLTRAYQAKRSKELSAAETLFTTEALQAAFDRAELLLDGLEDKLNTRAHRWLYSDRPTMADLFWGIELLRMHNIGFGEFWERRPRIGAFLEEINNVPSIRSAILDWPGALF